MDDRAAELRRYQQEHLARINAERDRRERIERAQREAKRAADALHREQARERQRQADLYRGGYR